MTASIWPYLFLGGFPAFILGLLIGGVMGSASRADDLITLLDENERVLAQIEKQSAQLAREMEVRDKFDLEFDRFCEGLKDPLPDVRDGRVVDLEARRHRTDGAA